MGMPEVDRPVWCVRLDIIYPECLSQTIIGGLMIAASRISWRLAQTTDGFPPKAVLRVRPDRCLTLITLPSNMGMTLLFQELMVEVCRVSHLGVETVVFSLQE